LRARRARPAELLGSGAKPWAAGYFLQSLVATGLERTSIGDLTISSAGVGGQIAFSTAGAERMRINSTGNVLVGKTSTVNATTVDGFAIALNASGGGTVVYATNGGTGTALSVGVQADTQAIGFYRSGSFVGSVSVTTSGTTYNTSSDYRLKNITGDLHTSGAFIDALQPRVGTWKVDGSAGQGFIAHELAEVVPGCVSGEKDAVDAEGNPQYQGIDTSFLVATLTAAIQEQQAIIESLTARVVALEQA